MVTQHVIERLLVDLDQAGVELWVEDGRLRSRALEGAITAAQREQIRLYRDEIIAMLQQGRGQPAVTTIQPVERSGAEPLSYAQQRLWFLEELGSGAAYNIPLALALEGALDLPALQQSLREVVRRHESLRTTFALHAGTPYQVIQPAPWFELPVVDLRGLSGAAQANEVNRLSEAETLRPFDLAQDLMLRGQLLHGFNRRAVNNLKTFFR